LTQFGKDAPAIGFTVLIDDLMEALNRQGIRVSIRDYDFAVFLCSKEEMDEAISIVTGLRHDGVKTELSVFDRDEPLEDYLQFIEYQGAKKAFVLDGESVDIYDLLSGQHIRRSLREFREEY